MCLKDKISGWNKVKDPDITVLAMEHNLENSVNKSKEVFAFELAEER